EKAGDLVGAAAAFEQALDIRRKALGPDHPDTIESLARLGLHRLLSGDAPAARPLLEEALAARRRAGTPDHLATAGALAHLAQAQHALGDLHQTWVHQTAAHVLYERVLGEVHPDAIRTLTQASASLLALGNAADARLGYERALRLREASLGPNHPQ